MSYTGKTPSKNANSFERAHFWFISSMVCAAATLFALGLFFFQVLGLSYWPLLGLLVFCSIVFFLNGKALRREGELLEEDRKLWREEVDGEDV